MLTAIESTGSIVGENRTGVSSTNQLLLGLLRQTSCECLLRLKASLGTLPVMVENLGS
jgi:hypothetical protein